MQGQLAVLYNRAPPQLSRLEIASLWNPGYPGTHYVGQEVLGLKVHATPPAEFKSFSAQEFTAKSPNPPTVSSFLNL